MIYGDKKNEKNPFNSNTILHTYPNNIVSHGKKYVFRFALFFCTLSRNIIDVHIYYSKHKKKHTGRLRTGPPLRKSKPYRIIIEKYLFFRFLVILS